MSSKIEWTQETWNPLLGCSKVSAGCKNCYAIRTAWIRSHNPLMKERYAGLVEKTAGGALNWTGHINSVAEVAFKPLNTKKPTMFFVNSMSDLFHEAVPFKVIDQVFAVMALCPQHTFQVLTKRPVRMLEYLRNREANEYIEIQEEAEVLVYEQPHLVFQKERHTNRGKKIEWITNELQPHLQAAGWYCSISYVGDEGEDKEMEFIYEGKTPFPNVWLGVSVENQAAADERIPLLLQVPAAVRFLSCEPLLGPVDLEAVPTPQMVKFNTEKGTSISKAGYLDWVICGGESGPGARPMHPDWARQLRDQCQSADVPFFFKQWGEYYTDSFSMSAKQAHFRVFRDFQHWVDKASTWVRGGRCISIDGRECKTGADFQACSYPVAIMDKWGKNRAGRLLDGQEWNAMPKPYK